MVLVEAARKSDSQSIDQNLIEIQLTLPSQTTVALLLHEFHILEGELILGVKSRASGGCSDLVRPD